MSPIRSLTAACALSLCALSVPAQTAPVVSPLVAFYFSSPVGNPILGPDGALYGVVTTSSSVTGGSIYRAALDGSSIETLFQIGTDLAISPSAGLTLGSDGYFYGVTQFGGTATTSAPGTVFRITPTGTGFTIVHRFAQATAYNDDVSPINTDGAYPAAELVEGSDGYFYGVASAGGQFGTGAVFKVKLNGTTPDFKLLHQFGEIDEDSPDGLTVNVDGAYPQGRLVQADDGFFYGTAASGGANGRGTIYRINPDGTVFQKVHEFSATTADAETSLPENVDGASPQAGLTADAGGQRLFGVTPTGGANGYGTLFAFSLATDSLEGQPLHDFVADTGSRPLAELLLSPDGDKLYGATSSGGVTSTNTTSTLGAMFSINTDGSGYTRLHSFESSVGAAPNSALLMLNGGDLVGTLGSSGDCGYGALYRYSASGTAYDGETSCGIRRRADDGGGHGGPAVLLLLGALGLWRRRVG